MNYFSKIIALSVIIAAVTGFFSIVVPKNTEAQTGCNVLSAQFDPGADNKSTSVESKFPGGKYSADSRPTVTITIKTANCSGKTLYVSLADFAWTGVYSEASALNDKQFIVPATNQFTITMRAGLENCAKGFVGLDCQYQLVIGESSWSGVGIGSRWHSDGTPGGNISYDCGGSNCNGDDWEYLSDSIATAGPGQTTPICNIQSAQFHSKVNINELRTAPDPGLEITLQTSGCDGWVGNIDLTETGGTLDNTVLTEPMKFNFTTGTQTRVPLNPGERYCRDDENPNCHIKAVITPYLVSVNPAKSGSPFTVTPNTLNYDCKGGGANVQLNGRPKCSANYLWSLGTLSDLGDLDSKKTPANADDGGINSVTLDNGASTIDPNSACYDKAKAAPIPGCYEIYGGLAQVLEKTGNKFSVITDADSLGGFLNGIIAVIIGLAGIAAVVMIMYHGVTYMKSDNVETKTVTRGKIVKTVLGLLLLLTMYTILRTINPDLLNLVPRFDSAALSGGAELTPAQFEEVTGEKLGTPGDYDKLAKETAVKYNSDYCALRVIIQNETRGNAALIGQDENAPVDISSRKAFVNSGTKFSGASFTPSSNLITDRKFCNDATKSCIGTAPQPNSPTLGLDWRFSKGIGLTQITFYPAGYKTNYTANSANKNVAPSRTFNFSTGAMTVYPKDVFKPEKNLEISAKLWNAGIAKCNTPKGAFNTYMCGGCTCSGSYATTEVAERTSQYNSCKAETPPSV